MPNVKRTTQRQAGTGSYFLNCVHFSKWKESGTRKSQYLSYLSKFESIVISGMWKDSSMVRVNDSSRTHRLNLTHRSSSTIIDVVKSCTTPLSGRAFFFFNSRNTNLKGLCLYANVLQCIISQLCSRCDEVPGSVEAMYQSHGLPIKSMHPFTCLVHNLYKLDFKCLDGLDISTAWIWLEAGALQTSEFR